MSKPRIPADCVRFMEEIAAYIERYDLRGDELRNAGPDVLDGWATRDELDPLIRRRLLTPIWYGCRDRNEGWPYGDVALCGEHFTAELTDRAKQLLWPTRAKAEGKA